MPADAMVDLFYAPIHHRHFLGSGGEAVGRSPALVQDVLLGLRPRPDAR
ncbi:hypothetical protein [Nocardiopsis dassonvillei]